MVLVLGYATGAASRISSRASDRYTSEALRFGTPARWTFRILVAELPLLLLVSAGMPAVVAVIYVVTEPGLMETSGAGMVTVLTGFGLLTVQLSMYVAVILATTWFTASAAAWPVIVAVATIFGYPLVVPLGNVNVFASFSMATPSGQAITWPAVCASVLVTMFAVVTAMLAGRTLRTPAFL